MSRQTRPGIGSTPVGTEVAWPYASWGMTADEIVAASGGRARPLAGAEQEDQSGPDFTTLAVDEVRLGPFEFDVSFRAAPGGTGLRTVRLELREPERWEALRDALAAEHGAGEPLEPTEPGLVIEGERWRTSTGTIVLRRLVWPMELGVDVVVDYEAGDDAGPRG